jgi:hypothetical protein
MTSHLGSASHLRTSAKKKILNLNFRENSLEQEVSRVFLEITGTGEFLLETRPFIYLGLSSLTPTGLEREIREPARSILFPSFRKNL